MSLAEATHPLVALQGRSLRSKLSWEQVGLAVLMTITAASFLWGLDRNGWANPYYSAAAQAGAQDWKSFFFGSFEWGNLITIDKTPLSTWVTSLSVRLFGLNSWSLLVPQAAMGITTTYLIYRLLLRTFGAAPALLGGLIYAATPVVFLMSRFNNPDPLMGLLMVAAVYLTLEASKNGRLRSFALAGVILGLAFMAKQAQALMVAPALSLAVITLGAGNIGTRIKCLLSAATTLITTASAWLVAVQLTPASERPYMGGSWTNSPLELTFDYNGLGRFIQVPITVTGDRPRSSNDELAPYNGGLSRMFDGNFAPEIAWFLFPTLALVVVLVTLNRTLYLNQQQKVVTAIAVIWFATALLILCFMGTAIHTYYTFSLAAPIALVLPIGIYVMWTRRSRPILRLAGAVLIGASGYMTIRILNYSDEWPLWLRLLVILSGTTAVAGWMWSKTSLGKRATLALVAFTLLIGPVGADSYTFSVPQKGTNPQSGPIANDPRAISRNLERVRTGDPAWALQTAYGATPSESVLNLMRETAGFQDWAAATYSAQNAALYQLESGRPVIPIGGWLGTDPAPTLGEFKELVREHRIGYFIWQQDLLDRGELSQETIDISRWVGENFEERSVDGVRIYDLRE